MKYVVLILLLLPLFLAAQNCLPEVTITTTSENICEGTPATFNATVKNEGSNGIFNWKKNTVNAGVTTADYTASDLHENDIITCDYTSKTLCGNDTTISSPQFTVHVIKTVKPQVSVANVDTLLCQGVLTTFTTESFYGNAIPFYQWLVNGKPVGTNNPIYITDSLTNGSEVRCVLTTVTPGCSGTQSTTGLLSIYVYPMVHPAIKIAPSSSDVCRGETVNFTATANGGAYPSFVWEINGQPTGDTSTSFSTSSLNDGDYVSCTVTIDPDTRCSSGKNASSNEVTIHVKDFQLPTIMINSPNLAVCTGGEVAFTSSATNTGNYTYYKWTVNDKPVSAYSPVFSFNQFADGDKVQCILTTNIPGCQQPATALSNTKTVTVNQAPIITVMPESIIIFSGETAEFKASVSNMPSAILWQPSGAVAAPQSLATATIPLVHDTTLLLSVTDVNGCTSGKTVTVKVLRKLYMPTAFTPNNDGLNDVFRLPPDATIDLKEFAVFDRWGNKIFKTSDLSRGWDGSNAGLPLDAGIYIYLITGYVADKPVTVKGTVALLK
ncbi:MAG: gliding motility-associated C-terminal domain-containing protein [Ferruginibacter sp.]